jgi:hypothetical protein
MQSHHLAEVVERESVHKNRVDPLLISRSKIILAPLTRQLSRKLTKIVQRPPDAVD